MSATSWVFKFLTGPSPPPSLLCMWSKRRSFTSCSHCANTRLRPPHLHNLTTMLTIVIITSLIIPSTWISPALWIWPLAIIQSAIAALMSLVWLNPAWTNGWLIIWPHFGIDGFSAPLLALSCWLLPLTFLASQHHLKPMPCAYQRMYITLLTTLQSVIMLAFGATELILFYVMFEATLIPTLFIITRWGNQKERLLAGNYFIFYTLGGSLPLLVSLVSCYIDFGTISLLIMPNAAPAYHNLSLCTKLWWLTCLLAFIVKLPLYGVHLWLPKAHVEAPIAGSIVLAAILLKLGGFGMLRLIPVLQPLTQGLNYPIIVLALWGVIITSAICLRQTDVKSIIAYSSVSHMGLVVAGLLTQTTWGVVGAIMMIIAHGLTSSLLFALANTNYERTHTRTILLARGMQVLLPLIGTWWFFACLANLGLPPLPNLMAELTIITSLFNWSPLTILITGGGALITVAYSLFLFLTTQRGPVPKHIINMPPTHTREHLLIALHSAPLIMMISAPHLIFSNYACRYSSTRTLDCDSKNRG